MNQREFFKSVSGLVAPKRLHARRVAVVGLGSGGCRVAVELGRLGVDLLLVERPGELLEEHNIVRHVLGYRSLGKPKLSELARHLRNLNPSVRLTACALDVAEQEKQFRRRLEQWRPDVLAVCTDNEQSKHALNHSAIRLEIPQVGGGVYDGGIGGEVYRVRPGDACYGCIAAQLQLQRPAPEKPVRRDYTAPENPDAPSTCALNLDIEQIALLHSRLVLDLLLDDPAFLGLPPGINLFVFANRLVPGTFSRPLHCDFFSIPRHSTCLECGEPDQKAAPRAKEILSSLQLAANPKPG